MFAFSQPLRRQTSSRATQKYLLCSGVSSRRNSFKAQNVVPLSESLCVAVLYQANDPPLIDGVRKLRKTGGVELFLWLKADLPALDS